MPGAVLCTSWVLAHLISQQLYEVRKLLSPFFWVRHKEEAQIIQLRANGLKVVGARVGPASLGPEPVHKPPVYTTSPLS